MYLGVVEEGYVFRPTPGFFISFRMTMGVSKME
jgi:hypothetical protein